jgi:nicotinamidase/pyrazinamidase
MREEGGVIIGSRRNGSGNSYDVGQFDCRIPGVRSRTLKYLRALDKADRYPHCLWPPHCLIGTPGHNVVPTLMKALLRWARQRPDVPINYVIKGSNPFVEHFSAVRAEVVDPADPSTKTNTRLIKQLMKADEVLVAGEAGSHCVANTVRDIVSVAGKSAARKLVLLTDCMSPVSGCEELQESFVAEMKRLRMQVVSSKAYRPGRKSTAPLRPLVVSPPRPASLHRTKS